MVTTVPNTDFSANLFEMEMEALIPRYVNQNDIRLRRIKNSSQQGIEIQAFAPGGPGTPAAIVSPRFFPLWQGTAKMSELFAIHDTSNDNLFIYALVDRPLSVTYKTNTNIAGLVPVMGGYGKLLFKNGNNIRVLEINPLNSAIVFKDISVATGSTLYGPFLVSPDFVAVIESS